jgi:hypothetical protein
LETAAPPPWRRRTLAETRQCFLGELARRDERPQQLPNPQPPLARLVLQIAQLVVGRNQVADPAGQWLAR